MIRPALPLLLLVGCTHPTPNEDHTGGGNIITEEEIVQSRAVTAYDAIVKLRGNFLSNRGKTTILGTASPLPMVYLDGVEYGQVDKLRDISANSIFSIRLYRAWEAAKFGTNKTGGVIEIVTKTQ